MESHKYPKAMLKGKINEWAKIDLKKNGNHAVTVTGDLTIHGVTQKVTKAGKVEVKDGKIRLISDFDVTLADYNIAIPKIVEEKIAKTAQVSLNMALDPAK
jgi:polyisoprenoid-binding protein YceI